MYNCIEIHNYGNDSGIEKKVASKSIKQMSDSMKSLFYIFSTKLSESSGLRDQNFLSEVTFNHKS